MFNYLIIIVLISFSALFSGLTLGLMSLNAAELKRKMDLGDKDAAKVYKVRKQGNLLLTTLLIGNVAVNSAIAIFLGSIASGVAAGIISTSLIVVFGEITPQAIFSRYALTLGAKVAWLVQIFIYILYPITWPIAWVLNKTLGEELPTIYSKKELMKIIEEHEDHAGSDIDEDEEKIVKGALSFSDKTVKEVMTPRSVMDTVSFTDKIDDELLDRLKLSGFSRFPVYKGKIDKIVGILYVKKLIGGKYIGKTIGSVVDKNVLFINENKKLDYAFSAFLKTHIHLFVVQDEFGDISGVITLENIIEEIIDNEIVDEDDIEKDLRKKAVKNVKNRKEV